MARHLERIHGARLGLGVALMLVAGALSACGPSRPMPTVREDTPPPAVTQTPTQPQQGSNILSGTQTTASGLQYIDTQEGTGAVAHAGQQVTVHYTGWLYNGGVKGAKFDSSVDRGRPFKFLLGAGQVIAGWDEGVSGMKVGGKRTLILPPQLGYGQRGAGDDIPPNATLMFDVELLGVEVRAPQH